MSMFDRFDQFEDTTFGDAAVAQFTKLLPIPVLS